MMLDELRRQIDLYLPKMEPGDTILDAGCHRGAMYDILINEMKLPIAYFGIEINEDLYLKAVMEYGNFYSHGNKDEKHNNRWRFSHGDFMNHTLKYDYVWCGQMTHDDNGSSFRHLAGLAKKGLFYSHIHPQRNHEEVKDAVKIESDNRFRIYIA